MFCSSFVVSSSASSLRRRHEEDDGGDYDYGMGSEGRCREKKELRAVRRETSHTPTDGSFVRDVEENKNEREKKEKKETTHQG